MNNLVVLSGAGISAESGISTFRDSDGLWENHDVMSVASIDGWRKDPALVLNFYNERREKVRDALPNEAHLLCANLQEYYNVHIVTQNVDDLHERAGSTSVIHLHGSLLYTRSERNAAIQYPWTENIKIGDLGEDGAQLRPDIVWFGEEVPMLGKAMDLVKKCDILLVIGTSLQVYPAASLVGYAVRANKIYLIDPLPVSSYETSFLGDKLEILQMRATEGMRSVFNSICSF